MNNNIVTYDQLQQSTGRQKPAEVTAWLAKNGVPYFTGANNRPWTTIEALNMALGIGRAPKENNEIKVL